MIAATIAYISKMEIVLVLCAFVLDIQSRLESKENMLFKRFDVVENLGNANDICIDKTGVITTNSLAVQEVKYLEDLNQEIFDPRTSVVGELLSESVCYNTTAFIEEDFSGTKTVMGNPIETCLIKYLIGVGFNT